MTYPSSVKKPMQKQHQSKLTPSIRYCNCYIWRNFRTEINTNYEWRSETI